MKKQHTEKNMNTENNNTLRIANLIKKHSGIRKLKKTIKRDSINFENILAIYI